MNARRVYRILRRTYDPSWVPGRHYIAVALPLALFPSLAGAQRHDSVQADLEEPRGNMLRSLPITAGWPRSRTFTDYVAELAWCAKEVSACREKEIPWAVEDARWVLLHARWFTTLDGRRSEAKGLAARLTGLLRAARRENVRVSVVPLRRDLAPHCLLGATP